jgi:MarR family transcriptional regulator for hemolysin
LTYHLNAMEADGLLTRRRHRDNRRVHVVDLTEDGQQAFEALRTAATRFDQRLRKGLPDEDIERLRTTLRQMSDNVGVAPPDPL